MKKYRLITKKGEGTFSEVLKAQNINDNKFHAIKCMKNHFDNIEQVNNLREIQALRRLSPHPHVIKLEEVLYDAPTGRLALVFELMEGNLYEFIRGRKHYLKSELIQSLMYQVVQSLEYMHSRGIFHRDIKPENILIDSNIWLKLADFGSCRGIYSKQPYTEYISTRWYRAPECLLTDGYYGPEMDLWGIGCVFFEITSLYPLFPGTNELDQIHRIHQILGTPSEEELAYFKKKGPAAHLDFNSFTKEDGVSLQKLIPHASKDAIDLMSKFLTYNPTKRINAKDALKHPYFKNMREAEALRAKVSNETALPNPSIPKQPVTTDTSVTQVGQKADHIADKHIQKSDVSISDPNSLPSLKQHGNGDSNATKGTSHESMKGKTTIQSSTDVLPQRHENINNSSQNKAGLPSLPPISSMPSVQKGMQPQRIKKTELRSGNDGMSIASSTTSHKSTYLTNKANKSKHIRRRHHK